MSSQLNERMRTLLARRTNEMKDLLENRDIGDASLLTQMLDISIKLSDDVNGMLQDDIARRRDEQYHNREQVARNSAPLRYDDRHYDDRRPDDRYYDDRHNGHRPYGGGARR